MQRPYTAQTHAGNRLVGLVVVVLLHIGIVAALLAGLARTAVEVVKAPIETEIIEERPPELPDTPPPPPPPELNTPPPPPFIPPPEIQVAPPPPQQTAIQAAVSKTPPPPAPPQQFRQPARVPGKINAKGFSRPEYPSMSIRLEEEGSVVLRVYCDLDGRITDAEVQTSSGFTRLDDAAVKEAKRGRWKCTPGTADGQPEGSWFAFKYTFRIEDAR